MVDLVLLHGSTQSPAGFGPLVAALTERGHRAVTPTLASGPEFGIAEHVEHVIAQLPGDLHPPVVLAHSAAGLLLPSLARRLAAVHQIWLAAVPPDYHGGRGLVAELQADPTAMFNSEWIGADPFDDPALAVYFLFHDADLAALRRGLATLAPTDLSGAYTETPPADPARISSSYLLPTDDRTLRPAWMARAARERLGVEPVELVGGHNLYTAFPEFVAGTITAQLDRRGAETSEVGAALVTALLAQWDRIVTAADNLDLDRGSRLPGWRNREVLAHLAIQPRLLRRFLTHPDSGPAEMNLADNLTGTRSLAETIDHSTRDAAAQGRLDLAGGIAAVRPELAAAEPSRTVVTVQGSLPLLDYLRTRLVEAVVHGRDLDPPVEPDPDAARLAAQALTRVLAATHPEFSPPTEDPISWLDIATGRRPSPAGWETILPITS